MSEFKIGRDLNIGKEELNRMMRFMTTDGFKLLFKLNTESVGIFRSGASFAVVPYGMTAAIAGESWAVDDNYNIIHTLGQEDVIMPSYGTWYIKIAHKSSSAEVGVVNLDYNGNITGINTKFTEILRGQPHRATKISFPGSAQNPYEYTVQEVIDDTNARVIGRLVQELGIKYAVVGAFTPGSIPETKYPYRYDSCETIVSADSAVLPGQILLAKVEFSQSGSVITDMRSSFWKPKDYAAYRALGIEYNNIIGVSGVRYDDARTPMDKNIVLVEWGMTAQDWTYDTTGGTITINSAYGGRYKSISQAAAGDFVGWKLNFRDGQKSIITSSVKVGSSLRLQLSHLDSGKLTSGNVSSPITVAPDVDSIIIKASSGAPYQDSELVGETVEFNSASCCGAFRLVVPSDTVWDFNIKYCHVTGGVRGSWQVIPSDEIGYYRESSYDVNGVLNADPIDRVRYPYISHETNGFIRLQSNPKSYAKLIGQIYIGDLNKVKHNVMSNASPKIDLVVGQSESVQIFEGVIELDSDHFINLSKVAAVNGNRFDIKINSKVSLNGNKWRIITDYSDPVTFTTLYDLTQSQLDMADDTAAINISARYDGTNWIISGSSERNAGFSGGVWDRVSKPWVKVPADMSQEPHAVFGFLDTLQLDEDYNFYTISNPESDSDHWIVRIEPHQRQKVGDRIVILINKSTGVNSGLGIHPKTWSDAGSYQTEFNIRMGADLSGMRVGMQHTAAGDPNAGGTSAWTLRVDDNTSPSQPAINEFFSSPKIVELLWDGSDWIITNASVLDMFS